MLPRSYLHLFNTSLRQHQDAAIEPPEQATTGGDEGAEEDDITDAVLAELDEKPQCQGGS